MAIDRKSAAKAGDSKASDDKPSDDKIADALDPTTGGGVQDVVQVPSVAKDGKPDQTPGFVVLDPAAAEAADKARADSAAPAGSVDEG